MRKIAFLALCGALIGCGQLGAQVTAFEQKAAPQIAQACAMFHQAEADPMVQLALAGGTVAANVATGGAAGAAVALVKSYGDAFCSAGPPVGDATTPTQQAAWLADVTMKLLSAAGALKM